MRTNLIVCSLAALLAILLCPSLAASASWSTSYEQGVEALNEQDLAKAEAHFRKALNLVQSQSKRPEDTEQCMLKLADTLALDYKTEEARSLYQELLNILVKRYGSYSPRLAPVLGALGSIEESVGNHKTAMDFYLRAFHIYERNEGPYSPAFAKTLTGMAATASKLGATRQAAYKRSGLFLQEEPGWEESKQLESSIHESGDLLKVNDRSNRDLILDYQREILGKDRPAQQSRPPADDTTSYWERESESLIGTHRLRQTDENSQVASRIVPQPASESSLSPAFRIVNDTIFNQNHYEKNEASSKRTIATDIDALGPNHPSVANDLTGLAQLYISQQRYSEAEPLLKRALSIYRQAYGSNNLLTVNATSTLASVELQLGHYEQSTQLYREALTSGQQITGPNSLETARILNGLANLYFRQGKLVESCTFYQWAVASTQAALGENSPLLAASLKDYAQVLRSLGRDSEALAVEARANKILAASN